MDQQADSTRNGFAPTMLRGLVGLGPAGQLRADLALELGLSLWMRLSDTDLAQARFDAMAARAALVDAAGLDPEIEPIPLVGRSPEADIVNLATYLGQLIQRAAAARRCDPSVVVARAIDRLVLVSAPAAATEREAG
jgi:hypothetical protein